MQLVQCVISSLPSHSSFHHFIHSISCLGNHNRKTSILQQLTYQYHLYIHVCISRRSFWVGIWVNHLAFLSQPLTINIFDNEWHRLLLFSLYFLWKIILFFTFYSSNLFRSHLQIRLMAIINEKKIFIFYCCLLVVLYLL